MNSTKTYNVSTSLDLSGEVTISGSKNAALPILAATLLSKGEFTLNNVPRIGDVDTFLQIFSSLGVKYTWDEKTLHLDTRNLSFADLDTQILKKIRVSILLLAPLLYHFGKVSIPFPGGCNIGKRPIDAHLEGLRAIGYHYEFIDGTEDISLSGDFMKGDIELHTGFGVTSTENLLVANVLRPGKTTIKQAAIEPHVMDLIDFLRTLGADISIRYNHTIVVRGVEQLKNTATHSVISDYIESATFMIIAALSAKEYIDIHHARLQDLDTFLIKFREIGVKFEILGNDSIRVYRSNELTAVSLQTNIFPGFPTDIGSIFAVLMTQAQGTSRIHEILFEGRLNFLVELDKMGGHTALLNPHQALIFGKMNLVGAKVTSWDLRAGAAMVVAGMIAKGTTQVTNIAYIERGYENFVEKLQRLGANIEKI